MPAARPGSAAAVSFRVYFHAVNGKRFADMMLSHPEEQDVLHNWVVGQLIIIDIPLDNCPCRRAKTDFAAAHVYQRIHWRCQKPVQISDCSIRSPYKPHRSFWLRISDWNLWLCVMYHQPASRPLTILYLSKALF